MSKNFNINSTLANNTTKATTNFTLVQITYKKILKVYLDTMQSFESILHKNPIFMTTGRCQYSNHTTSK